MESFIFGLILFVLFYGFLCWLVFVESEIDKSDAEGLNDSGESQEAEIDDVDAVEEKINEAVVLGAEIRKIPVKEARRIASALKIKQTFRGKHRRKKWLVEEILKKLEADPIGVSAIVISQVRA